MYDEIKEDSIFHLLSWALQKSRRPVKSTTPAEIMAASEGLEELITLREASEVILQKNIIAWELVESRDHFTILTTLQNSVDNSIGSDVNCIRCTFETTLEHMGRIKGTFNPADIGTKMNTALTDTVVIMFATGKIQVDLSSCESKSRNKRLGYNKK